MHLKLSKPYLVPAAGLVFIDGLFILLHLALNFDLLRDRNFHLEMDFGYSEWWQYAKLFACSLLALALARSSRASVYVTLGLIFALLLAEDAIGFHEVFYRWGEPVLPLANYMPSQDAHNLWELLYGLVVGGTAVAVLAWGLYRTRLPRVRRHIGLVIGLLVLLGGFGVLVDGLHYLSTKAFASPYPESILGLVEDGGELLAVSLIAGVLLGEARRAPTTGSALP